MGKLGLDYDECTRIKTYVNNAITKANNEITKLNSAKSSASGCYASPTGAISTAISDVQSNINKLNSFVTAFDTFIGNIKTYDSNLAKGFSPAEADKKDKNSTAAIALNLIDNIEDVPIEELSTTNDVVDVASKIYAVLKNRCFIENIGGGKWRVVGSAEARAMVGLNATGATYRVGSTSFVNAGLGGYLPKGFTFAEYRAWVSNNMSNQVGAIPGKLQGLRNVRVNPSTIGNAIAGKAKDIYTITANDNFLSKTGKVLSYAGMAVDTYSTIKNDVAKNASAGTIVADTGGVIIKDAVGMAVSVGCADIGTSVGAAIGTALIPIPGAGTVIGAAVGFAAGYVGGKVYDKVADAVGNIKIGDKTAGEWAAKGIDATIDGVKNVGKKVSNLFGSVGKAVFG